MMRCNVLVTVALALFVSAEAATAAGIGMITDISGKITQDTTGSAVELLTEVEAGTRLRVSANATATLLYLASGEEYRFSGSGLYRIGATAPETLQGAKPVRHKLALENLPGARIKPGTIVQATLVLRSAGGTALPKLVSPVNTRTLDGRPEFRWEPVPDASSYRVEITDDNGERVAEMHSAEPRAALPAEVHLADGRSYSYRVETRLADGRTYRNSSGFTVLEADMQARIRKFRLGMKGGFSERVAYAVMLDRLGVVDAARAEWRALAAERGDAPHLKAQLLQ